MSEPPRPPGATWQETRLRWFAAALVRVRAREARVQTGHTLHRPRQRRLRHRQQDQRPDGTQRPVEGLERGSGKGRWLEQRFTWESSSFDTT